MDNNAQVLVYGIVGTVLGQAIALLTIMFNARQARLRDERRRTWELEDRKTLHVAIAENTQKTEQANVAAVAAFKEANHVNIKLQALGIENQAALLEAAAAAAAAAASKRVGP